MTGHNDWSRRTLRDLATINYGRDPSGIINDYGPFPVYGTSGHERLGTAYLYDGDSIVLGRKGTIERVHYASGRFWVIDTAYFLSDFKDAIPKWLFYFLQTVDLRRLNEATGVPSLSRNRLYEIPVSTPSGPEQAAIAQILTAADRAISEIEASLAKQHSVKVGMSRDLLTRGIDDRGKLRSSQFHAFKASPLGPVPSKWHVEPLGVALRRAGGFLQTGPFGSQLHASEYLHDGIPVVMPQDIRAGRVTTSAIARISEKRANDLGRHRLQPNDIVFSRRGDLSRAAAIGERERGWLCGTGCFLLRVSADYMSAPWLAEVYRHHLTQSQVETNAVGSTMPSLNNAVMERLTIAFPSVEEQREIADRLRIIDAAVQLTADHLHKLVSLRHGLLRDLVSGTRSVNVLLNASRSTQQ